MGVLFEAISAILLFLGADTTSLNVGSEPMHNAGANVCQLFTSTLGRTEPASLQ